MGYFNLPCNHFLKSSKIHGTLWIENACTCCYNSNNFWLFTRIAAFVYSLQHSEWHVYVAQARESSNNLFRHSMRATCVLHEAPDVDVADLLKVLTSMDHLVPLPHRDTVNLMMVLLSQLGKTQEFYQKFCMSSFM